MRYADARDRIKSGDVLAWRGTSVFARIIERFTGSSWSHVGIAWWYAGHLWVLQSKEGSNTGIIRASAALRLSPCDWISTGAKWTPEVETAALDWLDRPYSYAAVAEVSAGIAVSKTVQVCSLYCADVLNLAGLPIKRLGETPAHLVNRLLQAPFNCDLSNLIL